MIESWTARFRAFRLGTPLPLWNLRSRDGWYFHIFGRDTPRFRFYSQSSRGQKVVSSSNVFLSSVW